MYQMGIHDLMQIKLEVIEMKEFKTHLVMLFMHKRAVSPVASLSMLFCGGFIAAAVACSCPLHKYGGMTTRGLRSNESPIAQGRKDQNKMNWQSEFNVMTIDISY